MLENVAAITDSGLVREDNQDNVLARELPDGSLLLAVADGVGGLPGGDIASREAISAVADQSLWLAARDPQAALERAFALANRRVRDAGRGQRSPMATTLVAALVREGRVWLANVGDSRAYLFSGGRLEQLTRDHSLVAEQVRAGTISPEESGSSNRRHVITRCIGVDETVEPDSYGPVALRSGSVLLLCSDGLHGTVVDAQISALLFSGTADSMARTLVDAANLAGGPDNVSVVLLKDGI